jgi:hypothetical protein
LASACSFSSVSFRLAYSAKSIFEFFLYSAIYCQCKAGEWLGIEVNQMKHPLAQKGAFKRQRMNVCHIPHLFHGNDAPCSPETLASKSTNQHWQDGEESQDMHRQRERERAGSMEKVGRTALGESSRIFFSPDLRACPRFSATMNFVFSLASSNTLLIKLILSSSSSIRFASPTASNALKPRKHEYIQGSWSGDGLRYTPVWFN